MRLFISYARVDKQFCIQIVDILKVHEVWFDDRLYGGENWWNEILYRLEDCEGFLYLISKDSVQSEYCLKELQIAMKAQREIIPVLIQDDVTLPPEIEKHQYIDMRDGLTMDTTRKLLDSIVMAARRHAQKGTIEIDPGVFQVGSQNLLDSPTAHVDSAFEMGIQAMEVEDFDKAIMYFKQAEVNGFRSGFIGMGDLIRVAEERVNEIKQRKEAEREYNHIRLLVTTEVTSRYGCKVLSDFLKRYPFFEDRDNLASYCPDAPPSAKADSLIKPLPIIRRSPRLPEIEFVDIPMGTTRLEVQDETSGAQIKTIRVKPFRILKYPITKLNFQSFLDADDGYRNEKWWRSRLAKLWWRQNPQHPAATADESNVPRESVSWYSARAYTRWLAHHTELRLRLPYLVHWQRAVQGDDDRLFPWGDDFDPTRCNTRELGPRKPTPVDCYPQAASPYGVYDLAGNVWEWCMDDQEEDDILTGRRIRKKAVAGGSAVSPLERAQVGEHYYLHPQVQAASIGFRIVDLSE